MQSSKTSVQRNFTAKEKIELIVIFFKIPLYGINDFFA